jgi:hypothetical protein
MTDVEPLLDSDHLSESDVFDAPTAVNAPAVNTPAVIVSGPVLSGRLTKALNHHNETVRFLTAKARLLLPVFDVMSISKVCGGADGMHQDPFEAFEWTPANIVGDSQVAPQPNVLSNLDDTQLNTLVQSHAGANEASTNGDKECSNIECCTCKKKGHCANKCPEKGEELNWKKNAPGDGKA